ncbi:MAG: 6-phosphogluconolactonase [Desulfovibrio sp.]|jgi:6-phosphogluconolactonase|nr:6-phosphogluconolactonase [Desulfovibrio sp.]
MPRINLSLYAAADEADMAREAADIIVSMYRESTAARGGFTMAVSGGSTPVPLFRMLCRPEWTGKMDWGKITVYWADERCVPPESAESNYQTARKELLSGVDATRYYRMKGEEVPETAAASYAALLADHFHLAEGELPRFDCILLGVGTDGHTASLFPGDPALSNTRDTVLDVYPPKGGKPRITLSLPVLNNARCCVFMASGRAKHHILSTALNLMAAPVLPAQMVRPHSGRLCWIIDGNAYQG